ncbi:MAG TPA: branched-chain amino acid ABC transporter permease [Alphaproteobacteria bacterium]|nr:branched-chain amino acid ABC transporter permease [Alphaproteobacteria bacterium]
MAEQATIRRPRRSERRKSPLAQAATIGFVFGVLALYLVAVGLFLMFHARWIIVDVLSLGHATLLTIGIATGIAVARRQAELTPSAIRLNSCLAGAIGGGMLAILLLAMTLIDLRTVFIALSRDLFQALTFHVGLLGGMAILIGAGAALAVLGAVLSRCPPKIWRPILIGVLAVAFFGVFQELLQIMMQTNAVVDAVRDLLYTWDGLSLQGAIIIFAVVAGGVFIAGELKRRGVVLVRTETPVQRRRMLAIRIILLVLGLIFIPVLAGSYIGQVLLLVGLYILMGMGLNLEVGLAGLLDLGFVAFFAVGAYTTALLTADSTHALAAYTALPSLSYWAAMPIAVVMAIIVGVLFGIPVLGVRGDYLAVATMGLGEIVRVLVQSDFAAPLLNGAQGILQIPKPKLGGFELADPVDLYYLTLVASAVAAYFAWRLENSRLGRAWMAIRDDEDVAQALGINLVKIKLLAYGLGAAFAGLAGSIFATMLTSVYPSSFQLLISINVLALVIVGGMGSLPGVIVGSVALVGLPELLREFGEYRYLFYGAALIVMMRIRPEGLWPSRIRRRELHAADEEVPEADVAAMEPLEATGANLRRSGS